MAKLDKSALKSAMSTLVVSLGLVPTTTANKITSAESAARKAARIAKYQKILREGGFVRTSGNGKGKFRTIGAPIALEYAIKLIRLGGELPTEYTTKTPWANAVEALEALADAANIDRKVMVAAFGVKPATETAPAAQVVANVEGMTVIQHASAPQVEPAANAAPKGKGKGKKAA